MPSSELTASLGAPRRIDVPAPWQAQFDDLRLWGGAAWYERDTSVPASWADRRVRVHFGAVDYFATVWVNGQLAGSHEGGYLPFDLDIAHLLRFGDLSTLTVRVLDPADGQTVGPFAFAEIPHGKQSWYGPLGGIWQSVYLEASSHVFVGQAFVRSDAHSGRVNARAILGAPAPVGASLVTRIIGPDGVAVADGERSLEGGRAEGVAELRVPMPQLWELDAPRMYTLHTEVRQAGRTVDEHATRFGFRTVSTSDGMVRLNHTPIYLRGALDQDYHLETLSTPPSVAVLEEEMLRAKELGLNLLRCHIKVPDPRYLSCADRLGILVWEELPNWQALTEAAAARAADTLRGMIRRDYNHPSVIAWTVINEGWGIDLNTEDHRRWLAETVDFVREEDPDRLVVDNSACQSNLHLRSDLNDFHWYRAIPDQADEWRECIALWVSDPASTFGSSDEAARVGDEPLIVSEFGNWGLPDINDLRVERDHDPWWFESGEHFGDGIVVPAGILERFTEWGLDTVFGSWEAFVGESQEHQFEGLKYEIEDLRRRQAIAGYVVTELTDVTWECNGLLDMARNPKVFSDRFSWVNAPDVVTAEPKHRRYRSGETAVLQVTVAHCSRRRLDGATIAWVAPEVDLLGDLRAGIIPNAAVTRVGEIRFEVPSVPRPMRATVQLELRDGHGKPVNRNDVVLLLFPRGTTPELGDRDRVHLRASDELAPSLAGGGWSVVGADGDASLFVDERWSPAMDRFVSAGGRALVLAREEDALPDDLGLKVQRREGSTYEGDWAQGMGWLRNSVGAGLAVGPRMDLVFLGLTPQLVMVGYDPADREDVLAGCYVGWIHATAATVGTFARGNGAGVLSTFPLSAGYGRDPLGTALLDRLIQIAASPDLSSTTRM